MDGSTPNDVEAPGPARAAAPARFSLGWVVALNLGLAGAQILVGTSILSLALVSDGFHNLSDAAAAVVAQLAEAFDRRDFDARALPFGYARASTVGALVNVAALEAVCLSIALTALCRLLEPAAIERLGALFWVSLAGVVVNVASAVLSCWGVVEHHHVGCACHDVAVASPLLGDDTDGDEEAPRVEARRFVLCAGGCCVAGGASPLAPPALFSPTTGEPVLACAPCKPCAPAKAEPKPPAPDVVQQQQWWWRRLDVGRLALVTHHAGDAAMCLVVLGEAVLLRHGRAFLSDGSMTWLRLYLDPLLSLALSCAIAAAAFPVGRRAAWTLLEGAPADGDGFEDALAKALAGRARVAACALIHLRDAPGLERAALVKLEVDDGAYGASRAAVAARARRVLARYAVSDENAFVEIADALDEGGGHRRVVG